MAVITVSRQLGSGGSAVAEHVARALGYHLVDREIVDAVAERAGVASQAARCIDQHYLGGVAGLVYTLGFLLQGHLITEETYRHIATEEVRRAARLGDVVVVGRASQVILGRRSGHFHVHVVAPLGERIARVAEREGISAEAARRRVRDVDRCRRTYVWTVGRRDWEDPALYDLVINTYRLTPADAAAVVIEAARRAGVLTPPARVNGNGHHPAHRAARPAAVLGLGPDRAGLILTHKWVTYTRT